MIDVYIDDIKIKTLGYDGDKNQLAIENGENKAMLIFDDDVLCQLYILLKNRGEMKGLIPIYNKSEPITVKTANDTADVEEVKHGNWIDVPLNVYDDRYGMNKYNLRTKCSVCEYAMPREYPRFNICPNCGAKMDKE